MKVPESTYRLVIFEPWCIILGDNHGKSNDIRGTGQDVIGRYGICLWSPLEASYSSSFLRRGKAAKRARAACLT